MKESFQTLRRELPALVAELGRCCRQHGARHPELLQMRALLNALIEERELHAFRVEAGQVVGDSRQAAERLSRLRALCPDLGELRAALGRVEAAVGLEREAVRPGGEAAVRPVLRHPARDRGEAPFLVIWEVTRACALACRHCRAEAEPRANPRGLSTAEGRALIEQVAEFGKPYPLLVFTGGDPFEREDLFELVAYARELGLTPAVSPAATELLTAERIGRLADCGARAVSLSLDGASPESHDDFRRVEGSFARTLEGCAMVRGAGLKLQVNTTVTAHNVRELGDILRLVHELGASLWSVFFLVPMGRGRQLKPISAEEAEAVMYFLARASRCVGLKTTEGHHYKRVLLTPQAAPVEHPLYRHLCQSLEGLAPSRGAGRTPMHVNSGSGFVFISELGEVCPSGFLPLSAGNLRRRRLTDLYAKSPLFQLLRDPERLTGRCHGCDFRDVCGGSRARALAAGDLLGDDPLCAYRLDPDHIKPVVSGRF